MTRLRVQFERGAPFVATALSSASNFAAGLVALLSGSTAQFGAYSFAIAIVLLVTMLTKSALIEPVLSTRRASGAVVVVGGGVGLVAGAAVAIVGLVAGGGLGRALLIVGIALPALLIQDAGRSVLIHAGRPSLAVVLEVVWLFVSALLLLLVFVVASLEPATVLLAWAAGGVASAATLAVNRRWLPDGHLSDVGDFVRERLLDVVATAVLLRGFGQMATILSAVVLGLVAFGQLRASILPIAPLTSAVQAVRLLALRSEGGWEQRARHALRYYRFLIGLIAVWVVAVLAIGSQIGDRFDIASKIDPVVLVIVGVAWVFQAVGTYLETTYRLADRYRSLSRRYMISSPIAFSVVVVSSSFGLRPAALGILGAALVRIAVLSRRRLIVLTSGEDEISDVAPAPLPASPQPARSRRLVGREAAAFGRVGADRVSAWLSSPSPPRAARSVATSRSRVARPAGTRVDGSAEWLLTAVVFLMLRPVRFGAIGDMLFAAQFAVTGFAIWDAFAHPSSTRRWLTHPYTYVPLVLAFASLAWTVDPGSSVRGLVDLVGVSAISIMVVRRLRPDRRLIPIFRGVLAVGLVNLGVIVGGGGVGPRGSFVGLFDQKNGLGRAAFLIVICGLILSITRQISTRLFVGSAVLAAVLAVAARSGTAILLISALILAMPLVFQRVREVDPRRFNALLLYGFAGLIVLLASVGSVQPGTLALRLLGRDLDQNTSEVRQSLWSFVIDDIGNRPIFGHGYATFDLGAVSIWTGRRQVLWSVEQAHNGFLDTTYQVGLVGIAIVVGLQVMLLWRLWKASRHDLSLRPWLIAVATYTVLIASMNYTYSTLFGRLGVFWLLQSVIAITVADRIKAATDEVALSPVDERVPSSARRSA